MKPEIVHFDSCSDERFLESHVVQYLEDAAKHRRKCLLKLLGYVMRHELTDNQRECLYLVKIKGFSIKKVAQMRGVNPSTVCRHLEAAQKIVDKAFEHFRCIDKIINWGDCVE